MKFLRLDFANVIGDSGTEENFLSRKDIEKIEKKLLSALEEVKREKKKKEELSFLYLPYAYSGEYGKTVFGDTLWQAKEFIDQKAKLIQEKFSDYVQVAIGGSALGGIALHHALDNRKISGERINRCRIHMPDNIDPDWIGEILDAIDPEKTFLSVITKSRGNCRNPGKFLRFLQRIKKKNPRRKNERKHRNYDQSSKGTVGRT